MRVLVVHNRYREPGGEDAVVAAEVGLLRSAGFEVVDYVVANPESDPKAAGFGVVDLESVGGAGRTFVGRGVPS
jgi:hypothetical protein